MNYSDLYFVNSIDGLDEVNGVKYMTLFKHQPIDYTHNIEENQKHFLPVTIVDSIKVNRVYEGQYVFYDTKNKEFLNGNNDVRARKEVIYNNILRHSLYSSNFEENSYTPEKVYDSKSVSTYHVYVGHGNLSIIVLNNSEIWVIDCSLYDFMDSYKNYTNNFEECIRYIKDKHKIGDIKISKLLFTHMHYDHFSGALYLIQNKYFAEGEIWLNLYFSWSSQNYNLLLTKLKSMGNKIKIINPIKSNGNNILEIVYPDKIIKKRGQKINTGEETVPGNKINNASVLYKLNFNKKSLLFPGDLETKGWEKINHSAVSNSSYYCISHHGSFNGHLLNSNTNTTLAQWYTGGTAILMGRHNAYPGIFDNRVLADFTGRIYLNDQNGINSNPKFIELDWMTGIVRYH
ncbi:MBL fold metallo-hydrolase [Heliorestis acidaminivorans]|uniref:MBL fold metallo-hydrolase n=1 Tax=Heliorestis acidaminivorans TaxID=553427 RepID=A0A6I0EU29_9FIRM|nr:MBL fold metallo-hydrolase [Heliorestis acidaminivorans]KAB2951157.1 MBL fold metallo-hydrolase [Heliorestis acidaminivorans]